MKKEHAVLLSQLQATHATLHAAVVQLGASILALQLAVEGEDDEREEADPQCPECGRTENVLPCGADENGDAVFVCPCGKNFSVRRNHAANPQARM